MQKFMIPPNACNPPLGGAWGVITPSLVTLINQYKYATKNWKGFNSDILHLIRTVETWDSEFCNPPPENDEEYRILTNHWSLLCTKIENNCRNQKIGCVFVPHFHHLQGLALQKYLEEYYIDPNLATITYLPRYDFETDALTTNEVHPIINDNRWWRQCSISAYWLGKILLKMNLINSEFDII